MAQGSRSCSSSLCYNSVTSKCLDCDIFVCDLCAPSHRTDRVHRVIGTKDLGKPQAEHCSIHPHFIAQNFCETCDEVVCPECIPQLHSHHMIKTCEATFQKKKTNLAKYHEQIKSEFLPFYLEQDDKLNTMEMIHRDHYLHEHQKILQHDRLLKEQITENTNKLVSQLYDDSERNQKLIQTKRSQSEENTQNATAVLKQIEEALGCNDTAVISLHEKMVKNYILSTKLTSIELPVVAMEFCGSDHRNISNGQLIHEYLTVPSSEKVSLLQTHTTTLNQINSINVGVNESLWIKDSTKQLLQHIKLNDGLTEIITKKDLPVHLSDFAVTPKGQLLMAFPDNPSIKLSTSTGKEHIFFTFPNKLFEKPQVPLSLDVLPSNQVVVGAVERDGDPYRITNKSCRQVLIISENGKIVNLAEHQADGAQIFTRPRRICSNKEIICVIDRTHVNSGNVIAFSHALDLKWQYCGSNLPKPFDPCGIAVTSKDSVIICDNSNETLHFLNLYGQVMTHVNTRKLGVLQPFSLKVSSKGHLLVGTEALKGNNAKLHILQINEE